MEALSGQSVTLGERYLVEVDGRPVGDSDLDGAAALRLAWTAVSAGDYGAMQHAAVVACGTDEVRAAWVRRANGWWFWSVPHWLD